MSELVGQLLFGLAIGSIYSLVAIGFSMIYRATGLLHFAHPDLMMMGGMIGYTLATRTALPMPVLFVLSGLAVAALSYLIDRFGFRPMRRRGASLNLVIATIGWSIILVNVALFVWGTAPLSYPQPYLPKGRAIAGIVVVPQNLVMLGVGLAAMAALHAFFARTVVGQALRATAENPVAAMEKVKSTEGSKVIPELFKQGTINGAAGTYRITQNGEIETTVFIGAWAPSGKVEVIRAWTPPKID